MKNKILNQEKKYIEKLSLQEKFKIRDSVNILENLIDNRDLSLRDINGIITEVLK